MAFITEGHTKTQTTVETQVRTKTQTTFKTKGHTKTQTSRVSGRSAQGLLLLGFKPAAGRTSGHAPSPVPADNREPRLQHQASTQGSLGARRWELLCCARLNTAAVCEQVPGG